MKCTITFEAHSFRLTGVMLLHIAVVLHQLRINPEAFEWKESGEADVRLWLLVVREESRLRELTRALEATEGVTNVIVTSENQANEPQTQNGPTQSNGQ